MVAGRACDGVWGYPPARDLSRCVSLPMVSPSVRLCLTVCLWQWYPSTKQSFAGYKKSRDEPCFCISARLFGRKTSEIIEASFTPFLGIIQLMLKPVLNLLPPLVINLWLDLLPNAEEVLYFTDTTIIAERHFL